MKVLPQSLPNVGAAFLSGRSVARAPPVPSPASLFSPPVVAVAFDKSPFPHQ